MKKCTAIVLSLALALSGCSSSSLKIEAEYPKEMEYVENVSTEEIYSFMKKNNELILQNEENTVYSPINIYIALGMLAEITNGDTQQEILDVLGTESLEEAESIIYDMWVSSYRNDESSKVTFGNSYWLNNSYSFNEDTLERASKKLFTSSYSGEMGSSTLNKQLQTWLNDQTNDLLKDKVNDISLDPSVVLALYSAIYFKENWVEQFDEENNFEDVFYGSEESTVEYMTQSSTYSDYIQTDEYEIVSKMFSGGEKMFFILPKEDVSLDSVLESQDYLQYIQEFYMDSDVDYRVHMQIPKFDITSKIDLMDIFKELGITKAFSGGDFSSLTTDTDIELSSAQHNARLKIDEEGCEAAAFTEMMMTMAAMPPEYVDVNFVLNRPFIYVVTSSSDSVPLFVGTVKDL